MNLLVFGGTSFAGRHVVERALAEGHSVTTFNRGRTNPDLFPTVRALHGDRTTGDYGSLERAGPFDAVVDMCAYVPRAVREALAALGPAGVRGPYVLISSVSVYADPSGDPHADAQGDGEDPGPTGFTEDSALACLPAGISADSEEVTGETYGPLKVLTEQAAQDALPAAVLIIRPGLIVGPHDPTDRFTYWVRRMADGGEVLAPEGPDVATTQVVDASDLARWIVSSADVGRIGTYNAVAPAVPLARVLDAARAAGANPDAANPDAANPDGAVVTWVPWPFLEAEGVAPWTDLPAWVPAPMAGMLAADGSRAAAVGLVSRPIEAVVADVAGWDRGRGEPPLRAGMTREREAELLRKFLAAGPQPAP